MRINRTAAPLSQEDSPSFHLTWREQLRRPGHHGKAPALLTVSAKFRKDTMKVCLLYPMPLGEEGDDWDEEP